jgi:Ca2+/Na+ antiporter
VYVCLYFSYPFIVVCSYSPYHENNSESGGERFGGALLNVIIIIGIIVVMTVFLVVLYKYRCYKVLKCVLLMYGHSWTPGHPWLAHHVVPAPALLLQLRVSHVCAWAAEP